MAPWKTKFQEIWLSGIDANGHAISAWCKPDKDVYKAFCTIYIKAFSVENSGIDQVKQHSKGKKHTAKACAALSTNQGRIIRNSTEANSSESSPRNLGLHSMAMMLRQLKFYGACIVQIITTASDPVMMPEHYSKPCFQTARSPLTSK